MMMTTTKKRLDPYERDFIYFKGLLVYCAVAGLGLLVRWVLTEL